MTIWPLGRKTAAAPPRPDEGGNRVVGVIPCAGVSSRMGTSKALLDAGGRSFLAAVVGTLVGGGCDPVLVVVAAGQEDEKRRATAAGALVLVNPDPGEGPITSLRLALGTVGPEVDGVALCPVDHPLVRPETVAELLAAFREKDAPVVLPLYQGRRGHPTLFRREVFGELADPALEGGARTVVHRHLERAFRVEVDDEGVVTDIDTPSTYRAAANRMTR